MVDVPGLYGALQSACAALAGPSRRQAEQELQDLSQTPHPYLPQLVQLAWEQSSETLVLFHAGCLLKKGIVRDWGSLEGPTRLQLHHLLLQFLMDRHLTIDKAAWGQAVQCLCVLHKLWWQVCGPSLPSLCTRVCPMRLPRPRVPVHATRASPALACPTCVLSNPSPLPFIYSAVLSRCALSLYSQWASTLTKISEGAGGRLIARLGGKQHQPE